MLDGRSVIAALESIHTTHVVWVPDSHLGTWESDLTRSATVTLVRACREGEAIAIAGGLWLGGARSVVMMQCTGLFEAGDALRNIVFDLKVPLIVIVGVRGQRAEMAGTSADNCPHYTRRIVEAWGIPAAWLDPAQCTTDDLLAALRNPESTGQAQLIMVME